MFYNIKMKLLIGGKSRSIYMRKDGSAYYKSGGENVDVSYMFKKNGGGLKKQYIGGVQDNLGKVEQKKRSKKGFKQILGGAISIINFDKIEIKSEDIMTNAIYQADKAPKQLKNICCLALYGLGAAMTGELAYKADKDEIKVLVSSKKTAFLDYLKKTPGNNDIDEATTPEGEIKPKATALGFIGYTGDKFNSGGVPVTRAYILNKILQCFEGEGDNCIANGQHILPNATGSLYLTGKTKFIDPASGLFNRAGADIEKLKILLNNIYDISKDDYSYIEQSALNLHTVLFIEEQIGTPAPAGEPAAAEADDGGGGGGGGGEGGGGG